MAFVSLPSIFTTPYASNQPPTNCCCGSSGVEINIGTEPIPALNPDTGGVYTRYDQASAIIAAANRHGFPIFQGQ